jgi:probable rRNA maturation factor
MPTFLLITKKEEINMHKYSEIEFNGIEENNEYSNLVDKVFEKCFAVEEIDKTNLYINVIFTTPEEIRKLNNEYRNIDRETDVLSFPMYEKSDIPSLKENITEWQDTLGDLVISISRVKEQAIEYGHSFERELAYMLVHGFYHLMGEDHIEEEDKIQMREKEENVLTQLNITRD